MNLLNPRQHSRPYKDAVSRDLMRTTIAFFEARGHAKMRDDYHAKRWYTEFLDYVKEHRLFATLLTPQADGAQGARWDTYRNCEFAEILGFYGLEYWYTWQVSVLGLGPLWMSNNVALKKKTAQLLQDGGIFAFGLSEKHHGADIYASDMVLTAQADGTYRANGSKYYIGNGNKAAIVSTFGKIAGTDEYVFFAANTAHPNYTCIKAVTVSQSYVSEYALRDYPITQDDIIAVGPAAWDAALNTINIGKYNLGWASIGICTHAFYEAIHHAAYRSLYKMQVTDFPHVKQLFVDAYSRLIAMKTFASRAADYLRQANPDDRRYLLFNPMVKMKVTTQGEQVINQLWDVIAARGFEKDMYFQEASVAIRALPKLEGTVHVNIALIVKFMANYFFNPRAYPDVPTHDAPRDDTFLFNQGTTRGLGAIQFHDYHMAYNAFGTPNVTLFKEQTTAFETLLKKAAPDAAQLKDTGFLLAVGEIFALVVYGQLILENAQLTNMAPAMVEQIFDFMVRDMAAFATELYGKSSTTATQAEHCLQMARRPAPDAARFATIWNEVHAHRDTYVQTEARP